MKTILTLAAVLVLTGCTYYASPAAPRGSDQERRDEAQCHYEAMKATAGNNDPFAAGNNESDVETSCMMMRGYRIYVK